MRLTAEEILELKKQKPCKAWRVVEPPYAEPGKSYRSGGQEYTVVSVELLSDGDILRRFGKAEYATLNERFEEGHAPLWLVVIVAGDRTDKLNLLTPTGSPGDGHGYTSLRAKAMPEEPEAISRAESRKFALAVREAYALKREEKRRGARKQRYENKKSLDARRIDVLL